MWAASARAQVTRVTDVSLMWLAGFRPVLPRVLPSLSAFGRGPGKEFPAPVREDYLRLFKLFLDERGRILPSVVLKRDWDGKDSGKYWAIFGCVYLG